MVERPCRFESDRDHHNNNAPVMELVVLRVLETRAGRCVGSNPTRGTKQRARRLSKQKSAYKV